MKFIKLWIGGVAFMFHWMNEGFREALMGGLPICRKPICAKCGRV